MRYIWDRGRQEFVPFEEYHRPRRSDGVQVISDIIDDTWHPATCRHFDSKSEFRKATKAAGCIEVGNEKQTDRRQPFAIDTKSDVHEAVKKVNQGYRPFVPRESDDI
jgi:hypothetical protein